MPRMPRRACRYPGCPLLTDGVYCEEHAKIVNAQYNHFTRGYNISERYGKDWKKISTRYRQAHPLCESCLKENRYTLANLVHHIKPLSEGGDHRESNLMSLCFKCHETIHRGRGDR